LKYPGGGCWIWRGRPNGKSPYGRFWIDDEQGFVVAHRYAWAIEHGSCDPNFSLDHLCETTMCVRPDHMEMITFEENGRRQHVRRDPLVQKAFIEKLHNALAAWRESPEGKQHMAEWSERMKRESVFSKYTSVDRAIILRRAWATGKFEGRRKQKPYTQIDWSQPCQRGHERTPENTYFLNGRPRYCRACKYERRKLNEQNRTGPGHCTEDRRHQSG